MYAGTVRTETWTQPLVRTSPNDSGDPVAEDRQGEFMAELRNRIAEIARGEGPPWLWDRIGCAYMCAIPGHFDDEPVASLRTQVESDERLLVAALQGLPRFVRLAAPTLLGVFPTRCTRTQVAALHALLRAGLLNAPGAELAERIERRVAARNMDAARRGLWLAAGLLTDAKRYRPELVAFVLTGREPRDSRVLGFLVPEEPRRRDLPEPWDDWETPDIVALFKAFARWNDPWWGGQQSRCEATTQGLRTDWLLKRWLEILSERTEVEGEESLLSLSRLPALDRWFHEIDELRKRHVVPACRPTPRA